jgi:hypothetical protein
VQPAAAALPEAGLLVPGQSLGSVRLGMTRAEVRATWGRGFGRCRSCGLETWYYTYRAFHPEGAAVSFEGGEVQLVYTLWSPAGWHDRSGLALGATEAEVTEQLGRVPRRQCDGYWALVRSSRRADSIYYVRDGKLWGLGLTRPAFPPCV